MPLPKNEKRHGYSAELPSGRTIKFRPWIVREEQEYMYATEGLEDINEYTKHIDELLEKCIEDDTELKQLSEVDYLAFVVELRKKSKGETHEVVFTCPHCQTINDDVYIDLNTDIVQTAMEKKPIEIGDREFTFKDTSRADVEKLNKIESAEKKRLHYMVYSLASVATPEQTYGKFSVKETLEFFGTMDPQDFKKLSKEFAKILPEFAVRKVIPCEKCKKETIVFVDKVTDFFV